MTIQEAIKVIITKEDSLNFNRFIAMIDDLSPEYAQEQKVMRVALDDRLLKLFMSKDDNIDFKLSKIVLELNSKGLSTDWIEFIIESFGIVLGWDSEIQKRKNARQKAKADLLNTSKTKNERTTPITPLEIPLEMQHKIKAATNSVAVGANHTVVLKADGTVVAYGDNKYGQCSVQNWKNITQIVCGAGYTAGLKGDGTVITAGHVLYGGATLEDVRYWKDIVYLSAGVNHLIGLRKNGKPFSCGYNGEGQCDVLPWNNIVDIAAGYKFSVGLKKDGSLIYIGGNNRIQPIDVSIWRDIVQIEAGNTHIVGLQSNGRVVASGKNDFGECDVCDWEDVVSISACMRHTIGLKKDGSLMVAGEEFVGLSEVIQWRDVLFVSIFSTPIGHGDFYTHVVAITSDYKILYAGEDLEGQERVKTVDVKSIDSKNTDKNISNKGPEDSQIQDKQSGAEKELSNEKNRIEKELFESHGILGRLSKVWQKH